MVVRRGSRDEDQEKVLARLQGRARALPPWSGKGQLTVGVAHYGRVWLPKNTYDRMECGVVQEGLLGSSIDMGVYADSGGSDPSPTGPLLASTGAQTVGASHAFHRKSMGQPLVIASDGYYWLAIVASGLSAPTLVTSEFKLDRMWAGRLFRFKAGAGSPLGDAPGAFDDPADSAVVYIDVVEQEV